MGPGHCIEDARPEKYHPLDLPQSVQSVIDRLTQAAGARALLLYGSSALGPLRTDTDVDLLLIDDNPTLRDTCFSYGHYEFDVRVTTIHDVRSVLQYGPRLRAGVLIHTLINSRTLFDPGGVGGHLQSEAEKLWQTGPGAIDIAQLQRSYATADKSRRRLVQWKMMVDQGNRRATRVAAMEIATILLHLAKVECRMLGIWPNALGYLLSINDDRYRSLVKFLDAVAQEIDLSTKLKLSVQYSTELTNRLVVLLPHAPERLPNSESTSPDECTWTKGKPL